MKCNTYTITKCVNAGSCDEFIYLESSIAFAGPVQVKYMFNNQCISFDHTITDNKIVIPNKLPENYELELTIEQDGLSINDTLYRVLVVPCNKI